MKIVMTILRYLLALALLFFGLNKIFLFMEPPTPPADAESYWMALTASKTMLLVAIVETLAGISLLIKKYDALMMIVLMSVSINAVLYHITLDPANTGMAIVLLVLNILMIYDNMDKYKSLLSD